VSGLDIAYLAVPRGLTKQNGFNGLERGLGENAPIDIQDVSDGLPKPSWSGTADRPDLMLTPETYQRQHVSCAICSPHRDGFSTAACR
jgi:hypothetical protein